MEGPLVSIGIPVYRRLHYLEGALRSVAAQTYESVELIVSDNGQNGPELEALVARAYPRPFRLRRNPETVGMVEHYNQLVAAASGEYFVLLADDDELSPNYVEALAPVLRDEPEVGVALARLEVIDEEGQERAVRNTDRPPPARMRDTEFVRIWTGGEYNFVCFATFMTRTTEMRNLGGFPLMPRGTSVDNGLILKLSLNGTVAFIPEASFRYRVYESSHGLALSYRNLARDLRVFLDWLDTDADLRAFARARPRDWAVMRESLRGMTWRTYRSRWRTMYRRRLPPGEWIRAAFAMPFIPAYYRAVADHLARSAVRGARRRLVRPFRKSDGSDRE